MTGQHNLAEPMATGRIEALRKIRKYYLESLVEIAEQIKALDAEIEKMNMEVIGDDGL